MNSYCVYFTRHDGVEFMLPVRGDQKADAIENAKSILRDAGSAAFQVLRVSRGFDTGWRVE